MKLLLITLLTCAAFSSNAQQFINFTTGKTTSESKVYEIPQRQIIATKQSDFEAEFSIQGGKIAYKKHGKETYQFIHVNGFGKITKPGHPALPMTIEQILMPKGANPIVKIGMAKYKDLDGFTIHPALEPAKDTYNAKPPKWQKDETVYGKNAWYPENPVSIQTIQYRRGFPIALVAINPVQYNPVTGKIRVYESLSYHIQFNGDSKSFDELKNNHTAHFTKLLKNEVLNSNIIPTGKQNAPKDGSKNYIIITHSAYLAAADTLAKWKRQMGYTVEIVSQSSWTSDQVKDAIHSRYESWSVKPDYFVIIGDHTGEYAVPGEEFLAPDAGGYYASDLYYACMDGASDYNADMAFGRIAVASFEQAMTVVMKTVNYERNPVTNSDFYTHALNCAQFQDVEDGGAPDGYAARRFCHTSEDIRDYTISQGYNVDRIYYTEAVNTPTNYNNGYYSDGQPIPSELLRENGFPWNGNSTQIKNAIEDGRFYVFHRDHGFAGGTGWSNPYFVSSSASSLTNGNLLPVVFSINCHTGEFSLKNCFAESFIRNPNGGAVGVVAAAYYSYSGYNDGFSAGMIDAIWSDPGLTPNFGNGGVSNPPASSANNIRTMGDVLNQGLTRMQQTWGYSIYTHRLFHYFGDPAMQIWTENPNNNLITSTHSNSISCDESVFTISNCNTEGAKVTILQGNKIIGYGTITDGSVDINYSFSQNNSTALLTITAENHKPYMAEISLTGNCAFPPIVTTGDAITTEDNNTMVTGEIIDNTFGTINSSGVCYSQEQNPALNEPNSIVAETSPVSTNGTINLLLENLQKSTRYYYKAFATNEYGTGIGETNNFITSCKTIIDYPLKADFAGELIPACWETSETSGEQGWRFDNPGDLSFGSTTAANGFASLNSEFYGSGNLQNANLITPRLDFSAYGQVSLAFEHYFRSANSGDTATVYYSLDNGESWSMIQQWYTSTGTISTPNNLNIDLSNELAGQANVKFKWNYEGGSDYYWLIDDIAIDATEFSRPIISNNDIVIENGDNLYDYTTVSPGNSMSYEFKLCNAGDQSLNIEEISIANPEFTISTQPEALVEENDTTAFIIEYNPADIGKDSLLINVNSDGTMDGEYNITLFVNLNTEYDISFNLINSYGDPIENATVELDGYGTANTNSSGDAIMTNIPVQERINYNINHAYYEQTLGNITLTHENEAIQLQLTGNPIQLTFNVTNGTEALSNASIYIENGGFAVTSGGTATIDVSGMQNIGYRVSRSGYEDYFGNVNVMEVDQNVNIEMTIDGNRVTANITSEGSPVENATVTVMDAYSAQSDANGVAIIDGVPSGLYRDITVEAENYGTYNGSVNILTDVEVDIEILPAFYCKVNISVMENDFPVANATVNIDGDFTMTSNTDGLASFDSILNGEKTITISKSGYESIEEKINLVSDTTIAFQIEGTGIQNSQKPCIKVYPNPAHLGFYIETSTNGESIMKVYNSTGKLIYKTQFKGQQKYFDTKLEKGLYFIHVLNGTDQNILKLVIE